MRSERLLHMAWHAPLRHARSSPHPPYHPSAMPLLVPTPTTSLLSGGSQSVGAATLRTLPAEQLLAEHARLEHSVAHLQRSNAELHASLAVQGEGTEEWSDEDRKELSGAVRENEETMCVGPERRLRQLCGCSHSTPQQPSTEGPDAAHPRRHAREGRQPRRHCGL